jgi:cation-transporting P-type ATPase C
MTMAELESGVFSAPESVDRTGLSQGQADLAGSLRRGILSVLALSGFTLFYLWKRFVLKAPLSASWLTAATLLGGANLFYRALSDLRRRRLLSANTFLSAAVLLAIATGEAVAALEVIWIQEVGQLLEDYIQDRSRRAVRELFLEAPGYAFVIVDGVEVETPVTRIRVGDILSVRDTDRIPVDGEVVQGRAEVDEAHITGRPEPELRTRGDKVFAGTTVQQGQLQIKAQEVGDATYLAQVARMVEESLSKRTMVEKQADQLASRLAVLGIGAGAATFLLTGNISKTLAVQLALASPCATVLAASTAVTAALANAARNRVLIKGGPYLESFASIDCTCFDKTGTLTENLPVIAAVMPGPAGVSPERILGMAAASQQRNIHPIARSLVQSVPRQDWPAGNVAVSATIPGRGVKTGIGDDFFAVGNPALMQDEGIDIGSLKTSAARLAEAGCSVIYVARNGQALGVIGLKYDIKPKAALLVAQLRRSGIDELHLLSGDNQSVVAQTAKDLNLTQARGDMLPEDKAAYVAALVAGDRKVAMVGDGINDAPALARAHVGIAMGAGGAEAAIEAADIALMDSELDRLLFTRRLSRQTLRIIAQNHWFAITTDLISAMLAMAGIFSPLLSGGAHIFHTLAICANSGRLLSFSPKDGENEAGSKSEPLLPVDLVEC